MENKFAEMEGGGKDSAGEVPAENADQTTAGERLNLTKESSGRYSQHLPASSSSNPESEGSRSPEEETPGTGAEADEARCLEELVEAPEGNGKGTVKSCSCLNPDANSTVRITKVGGDTREEGKVWDSNSWSKVEDMLSDSEPSVGTDNTDSDLRNANNNTGDENASASGTRASRGGGRGRRERRPREDMFLDFDLIFEIGDVDTTPSSDQESEDHRSSRDFGAVGRNRRDRDGSGTVVDTTSSSDVDCEDNRNRRHSRALREYWYRRPLDSFWPVRRELRPRTHTLAQY